MNKRFKQTGMVVMLAMVSVSLASRRINCPSVVFACEPNALALGLFCHNGYWKPAASAVGSIYASALTSGAESAALPPAVTEQQAAQQVLEQAERPQVGRKTGPEFDFLDYFCPCVSSSYFQNVLVFVHLPRQHLKPRNYSWTSALTGSTCSA